LVLFPSFSRYTTSWAISATYSKCSVSSVVFGFGKRK
jgi:hypothetical protein